MRSLHRLNPPQRTAVTTTEGPLLILAGAGTGKTRVITHRIAHLVDQGVPAGKILAVTFTNKAAREMQGRVRRILKGRKKGRATQGDRRSDRPVICTFHSLGLRILRGYIDRLGYKKNFVVYDEPDQTATLKKLRSSWQTAQGFAGPSEILAALSRWRNGQQTAGLDGKTKALLGRLEAQYRSKLKCCNAVDFDDLILLPIELFQRHADVHEACCRAYSHVMVDEYQDTSSAQLRFLRYLAQPHGNLCVVGDDDQSIYGWRGAEIKNLLDLGRYYPDLKTVRLEQNYRSTNTILKAANAVIQFNARRHAKELWSQNGVGVPVRLESFTHDDQEAQALVDEIEFLRLSRRVPWEHHAVLFRTNQQSRPIETVLRRSRVPYRIVGGQSFFDRREIKDALAYLQVLVNPDDDISLLRIANVPPRGLSDRLLQTTLALSQERDVSVYQAMHQVAEGDELPARGRSSLKAFLTAVSTFRTSLRSGTVGPIDRSIRSWLDELGYFDYLKRTEKEPENGEERVRNVVELLGGLEAAGTEGLDPIARIGAFLDDAALDTERFYDYKHKKEPTGVTLMTMHSCKGLEFPYVRIVGLEEGLLPHTRSKLEGSIEEERRLFYVAITRAKDRLSLSHCQERKKHGQRVPCHPSRFIQEIPEVLIEFGEDAAKKPVELEAGKGLFAAMRESLG